MTHPLTRPTLFPYTTLFRSRTHRCRHAQLSIVAAAAPRRQPAEAQSPGWPVLLSLVTAGGEDDPSVLAGEALPGRLLRQDRKSTRLNSSHPSISYAVFCLKK